MGKRWDLSVSHKDKNGKWRSSRVGVVFEGDKGQLQIRIDPGVSVSTPDGVLLTGWVPQDGDSRGGGRGGGRNRDRGGMDGDAGGYGGGGGGMDDDIPFGPVGDIG